MALFPKNLQLSSTEYLDPRFLAPVIHLQNARFVLRRHNLSPFCTPEMRTQAIDQCLAVARDTAHLLSRCMSPPYNDSPGHSPSKLDWRTHFSKCSFSILCTHLWRCILVLLFRSEYSLALLLIRASAAIGASRHVNFACGRNVSFFLRCLFERLQKGRNTGLEHDEEMMVYLSADMQSSTDSSWVWQGSETGSQLSTLGKRKEPASTPEPRPHTSSPDYHRKVPSKDDALPPSSALTDEEQSNWGSWEQIEQQVQFLLDQQSKQSLGVVVPGSQQQQLTPISPQQTPDGSFLSPGSGRVSASAGRATAGLPNLGVNIQRNSQSMTPISASSPSSANRMTIANII